MKKNNRKKEDKRTEQEKVDQRREEVLARGRKFKYPLQYAKHKLVFNTIIVSAVALVLIIVGGWFALYKAQSSWDVLYRVTRIVPLPVANVDGEKVLFSDYLMFYKSSVKAVEQQAGQLGNDTDSEELKDEYKRSELTSVEEYSYAEKLGEETGIEVTDEEIKAMFDEHRNVGGTETSEESFLKVLNDNFGLSKKEYERMLYLSIMKMKVSKEIDVKANEVAGKVEALIAQGVSYAEIANKLGEDVVYEETGVLVSNTNVDGGRSIMAMKLEAGQQSGRFVSSNGDGYYFVKLTSKTATEVNYSSLKIDFTEFRKKFEKVKEEGKIKEYITLSEE